MSEEFIIQIRLELDYSTIILDLFKSNGTYLSSKRHIFSENQHESLPMRVTKNGKYLYYLRDIVQPISEDRKENDQEKKVNKNYNRKSKKKALWK